MSTAPKQKQSKAPKTEKKFINRQGLLFIIAITSLLLSVVACTLTIRYQSSQLKDNLTALNTLKKQYTRNQIENQSDIKALSLNYSNQQQQLQTLNLNLNNAVAHNTQSQRFRVMNHSIYLIHQAHLQLNLNLATQKSRDLLKKAQHNLSDLHDDSLFSLQHNLNVAIGLLKSSPVINIPSMLQQLNQTSQKLDALSFTPTEFSYNPKSTQPASHQLSLAHRLAAGLKNLIIIRHHQFNPHVIPSISESRLAKINIQTKISIAQWALVHRQKKLFQSNLIDASKLVTTLFNRSPSSQKISRTLQQLANTNITPVLPDLNLTLHLANVAISPPTTIVTNTQKKTQPHHPKPMTATPKLGAALS